MGTFVTYFKLQFLTHLKNENLTMSLVRCLAKHTTQSEQVKIQSMQEGFHQVHCFLSACNAIHENISKLDLFQY